MKKRLFILILFLIFTSYIKVLAAPVSYERSVTDLRLPKDVDLGKINIEDVLKTPSVDAKDKIYDFANILSDAEEAKIFIQLNEYINNTGLDAIIVTTNDLKGFAMKDYTYNFYDYNDFKDNGVSFVIYVGPDKKSIFMGNNGPITSEVFTAYTDNRVSEILKYVYNNHIRDGDYYGACEAYIKLIDGFYVKTFGSYKVGEEITQAKSYPWIEIVIVAFVLTFIGAVLVVTRYQKPQVRSDQSIKKALSETTMIVKCEYDKPVAEKITGNS